MSRRDTLDLGLGAAASLLLPRPGRALAGRWSGPQPGDAFVAADGAHDAALQLDALGAGAAPALAWPLDRGTPVIRDGTRDNLVLLLRPVSGELAAFSAVCQHAGCVVSGWLAAERLLLCPCHGSRYDPARQGAVVAGPAPLPLPTLPVQVVDGIVLVAGPFSAQVGGHTGRTD